MAGQYGMDDLHELIRRVGRREARKAAASNEYILQQVHDPFGTGKLNASPAELFLQRLNSLRSDSSLC